jgi:[acyl-carrier-protein] S-malonyltransferase
VTLVLTFPGQSSRYPGMIPKLVDLSSGCADLLAEASDALGRDLGEHYRADHEQQFASNRDVQLGVFLCNHMFLSLLAAEGFEAHASLGLSLGEWNHLVHIGAVSFVDALAAVSERGAAYDAGPRGAMASVFPISVEELAEVVAKVQDHGVLEIVNLNSPRQQVLSGERAALDRALELLEEDFYVEAVIIEKDVPMHCSTFEPVGKRFGEYLRDLSFATPRLPYLPNRLAAFVEEPDFVELLSTHVHKPVLWRASIDLVLERWPDALLLEVGPRAVLTNLLDKKWQPGVRKAAMDSKDDTTTHLAELFARLRSPEQG